MSEVAEHFHLLEKNGYVDALLLADESSTKNAFATERARWKCVPKNIGNDGHEDVFELFHDIHGKAMVEMLRGLDFSLFELMPLQGRYVMDLVWLLMLISLENNLPTSLWIGVNENGLSNYVANLACIT